MTTLAGAAAALVAASSAGGGTTIVRLPVEAIFSFPTCIAGVPVEVTGKEMAMLVTTHDGLVSSHYHLAGGKGFAPSTGDRYIVNNVAGLGQAAHVQTVGDNLVFTILQRIRVVRVGAPDEEADDLRYDVLIHMTVTPDGTVRADVFKVNDENPNYDCF